MMIEHFVEVGAVKVGAIHPGRAAGEGEIVISLHNGPRVWLAIEQANTLARELQHCLELLENADLAIQIQERRDGQKTKEAGGS